MPSTLLTQFRQRYPQGSLTSSLLTIHDGQYVVRVEVAVEGVTLATGLAANVALEVAEDAATHRALERLGLVEVVSPPSATVAPAPAAPTPPIAPPVPQTAPAADAPEPDAPEPDVPDSPESDDLDPPLTYSELESADEVLAIPPAAKPVTTFGGSAPGLLQGDTLAPVDLSDIIAQTDVELQRLGWNVHQGREFLEKTYGKRSRHDLTDEELLEFLLFLETQSPLPKP